MFQKSHLTCCMKTKYRVCILFFTIIFLSCTAPRLSSQHAGALKIAPAEAETIQVSTPPFYVYENGEFKEAVLTKEPELIGGKDLMETLIKLNIRYPDKAKEEKIGGTVLVSVVIDSLGQMDDVFIHEGVGGGCNDEALRAVKLMQKVGFTPGEINGIPVIVKFDIPITFLPQ